MAQAVTHARRTAKLVASIATVWACIIALIVGLAPWDGSWQGLTYTVAVLATPLVQIMLIGAGTVRDTSDPQQATVLYALAIASLAPVHLFLLIA